MTTAIVDEIKKGCDAVLLALHGAWSRRNTTTVKASF